MGLLLFVIYFTLFFILGGRGGGGGGSEDVRLKSKGVELRWEGYQHGKGE